jgi:hypothetical protein
MEMTTHPITKNLSVTLRNGNAYLVDDLLNVTVPLGDFEDFVTKINDIKEGSEADELTDEDRLSIEMENRADAKYKYDE